MKPILMNGESVRGILEGRKTQTRRVIALDSFAPSDTPGYDWRWRARNLRWHEVTAARLLERHCPYGQVGDRLWVRETWAPVYASYSHEYPTEGYYFEWEPDMHGALEKDAPQLETYYRADGEGKYPAEIDGGEIHWKPSIFMPRWASRITLEIIGVKVERILDITLSDIRAEGISRLPIGLEERLGFADLWDSINAKRGYGWDVNPWVWALTFKVV